MNLTDRIVVDLFDLPKDLKKIDEILSIYSKSIKCSNFIDIGNDLIYLKRNINSFKRKLKKSILIESSKYEKDIFGNRITKFNKYRYAELLFSEDFTKLISVRLFGKILTKKRRKRNIRYSVFNLNNPFDPTIVNIIYNIKEIIEEKNKKISENDYVEFLKEYFAPIPEILNKSNLTCVDNLSQEFDTGKPKSYLDFVKETEKLSSFDLKKVIYNFKINSYDNNNSLSFLLGNAKLEEISEKIEEHISNQEPEKVINLIYEEILNKFNLSDLISYGQQLLNGQLNIDPIDIIKNLSFIDIFEKIDLLPKNINKQIYKELNSLEKGIGLLEKATEEIEKFTNLKIKTDNPFCVVNLKHSRKNIKIKSILKDLKLKFPDLYPQIEAKFNDYLSKDIIIDILKKYINLNTFSIKIPKIDIPTIELPRIDTINNLFDDISETMDDMILNSVSFSLSSITQQTLDLLKDSNELDNFMFDNFIVDQIKFDSNLTKFENIMGSTNWLDFVQHAYQLLIDSNKIFTIPQKMPEVLENLNKEENIQKISDKITKIPDEYCDVPVKNASIILSKKNKKISSLNDAIKTGNLEEVINSVKYYSYSSQHDFFKTMNIPDEKVAHTLKIISKSHGYKEEQKFKTPQNSSDIANSLTTMIQQLETVLTKKELSLLLKGKYNNTTSEIVKAICEINFPNLTHKVDPIKYFIILGKVLENTGGMKK